jgi:hypothetical protein
MLLFVGATGRMGKSLNRNLNMLEKIRDHFFSITVPILALVFLLLGLLAECKADTLYVGAKSHHFAPVDDDVKRESHALLMYEHSSGWMGGYWRNSYDRETPTVLGTTTTCGRPLTKESQICL